MDDHEARITRLEKDMWFGNGQPGMTTRMKAVEDASDRTDTHLEKHDKKLDRLSWMVAVGLGIVITLQFILKH